MKEIDMIELVGNVARKLAKRFGPFAAEAGLSVSEAVVLWKFRLGPCKASDIAERLGLSPSTITGILDRLEAGGWIHREADPADRRAVSLRPTKRLDEFMRSAKRSVYKSLERAFKDLPPDLVERVCGDLQMVLDCLDRDEGSAK